MRTTPLTLAASQGLYEELARPGTVLAFDFDGTLAPIVPHRDQAAMRPVTAERLAAVCALYETLVISGRARADVTSRLGAARPALVIGNHGAEGTHGPPAAAVAIMRDTARRLRDALAGSHLDLEDKGYSLTVHVPREATSDERDAATARVQHAVRDLSEQLRITPGLAVLNITHVDADHKGHALAREVQRRRAARVLYVGDDVTDEDVFRAAIPGLIGVHVGNGPTAASFVMSQPEIDDMLEALRRHRAR